MNDRIGKKRNQLYRAIMLYKSSLTKKNFSKRKFFLKESLFIYINISHIFIFYLNKCIIFFLKFYVEIFI